MDIILLWLFSTALPCWQIVVVSFDLLHRTGRLYKENTNQVLQVRSIS